MSLVGIPFSQYFKVHQYANVAANSSGRVFYGKLPHSHVGFIYKVGNNYHQDSSLKWVIDGVIVEGSIERQMGSVDNPATFNRDNGGPYLVKDYIEFTATNSTDETLMFEILCDGVIYMMR